MGVDLVASYSNIEEEVKNNNNNSSRLAVYSKMTVEEADAAY
jgi:hypothetical protein